MRKEGRDDGVFNFSPTSYAVKMMCSSGEHLLTWLAFAYTVSQPRTGELARGSFLAAD